jgi:hypothetical protein
MASARYAFLMSSVEAVGETPRILYGFSNEASCGRAILHVYKRLGADIPIVRVFGEEYLAGETLGRKQGGRSRNEAERSLFPFARYSCND